jgi:uncharacterized protein (DUF1499 family)
VQQQQQQFERGGSFSVRLLPAVTRRSVLVAATTATATAPAAKAADLTRKCSTVSNPATTVVTCKGFGVTADGGLNPCAADEACVSTAAVRNPSKYGPPWRPSKLSPEAGDDARAWRSVLAAVGEEPSLKIVERDDTKRYLRATCPSAVPTDGQDDVEFVLRDGPSLLYRSATRQSVFLYPLQQPIANQKSHVNRLSAIRARLGWEEAGLPTDGEELASEMLERYSVPTAQRIFGLQIRGVPFDYGDD